MANTFYSVGTKLKNTQTGQTLFVSPGTEFGGQKGDYFGPEFQPLTEATQATPANNTSVSTAPMGTQILNEQDLQAKREELSKAGISDTEFSKFISSPEQDPTGKLFFSQPATLTNTNTGEKKIVASGSQEASQLLSSGNWQLGSLDIDTSGALTSQDLANQTEIKLGQGTAGNNDFLANQTAASINEDLKATQEQIKKNEALLTPPKSELSKRVDEMLSGAETAAGALTGRGALQLSEEEKRGIETQRQAIIDQTTEINKKVAEINALTASFEQANIAEEGQPQTLSSLRGEQGRNLRMYLAQKNSLTAEAGYLQAELLGMQGKLDSAQTAANRAVDLEYQDRLDNYNSKLNLLNILLPQLEKDEARYATALQLTLQQQATALAEEKQTKKDLQNLQFKAISSGITDLNILNQIAEAETYDEALSFYAKGVSTTLAEPESKIVANLANKYADAGIALTDTLAQAQAKLPGSKIYQQATRLAGDGTSPGVFDQIISEPMMTFEEFVAEREQKLQQSLDQPARDDLKDEYDALVEERKAIGQQLDPANLISQFNKKVVNLAQNQREFAQKQFSSLLQSGDVLGAKDFMDGIGKTLNQTTINTLVEITGAVPSLIRLETSINNLIQKFGPVQGIISKYNKYDVDAQTAQAQINLVKQLVGKGLEGGVLRKEDEEKYKLILSQLNDRPQVALNKIRIINTELISKLNIHLDVLGAAGFNVQGVRKTIGQQIEEPQSGQSDNFTDDQAFQEYLNELNQ